MDVREAISRARDYLGVVFSGEDVSEVRLEETSFDREDQSWLITFGLLRPSVSVRRHGLESIGASLAPTPLKRSYKVVRIPNDESSPPSIRIREFADE